jgi:hypothetical protein
VTATRLDERNESARWRLISGSRTGHAFAVVSYLLVSWLVLYPILVTPVVADDFTNPFAQADGGGPSLGDALEYGWRGATEGASFRIIGNGVGAFVNWLLIFLSATFDIGISPLYSALKFVMILACAASVAWCWTCMTQLTERPITFPRALGLVSLTLFTTLQIHAYWSNDPVGNYPLVGFGATAIAFAFLALVLRFVREPSSLRAFAATVAAVIAVGYYELNVGAVMGAGFLLALLIMRRWADRGVRWTVVLGSAAIVLTPAFLLIYGRTVTGDQAQSYGGTTVRLGRVAVETFGLGVLSSLPGAAWGLSIRTLGGTLGIVWMAMAIVVLLVGITYVWVRSFRGEDIFARPDGTRLIRWVFGLACITFWFVAVAVQALTVKVQDEVIELGYVYTSYTVGAAVVSLGLAAVIRTLVARREWWGSYGPGLLAVGISFTLVQLTVNWRLSEQLNASFVPNRQLLAAFDDDASVPERCQALQNWTAGPWPDYYESGMVDGLEVAFEYYFDEPFCDGFTRPP